MFGGPDRTDEIRHLRGIYSDHKKRLEESVGGRDVPVGEEIDLRSGMIERIADELGMIYTRTRRGE
jgi:hypothetical protein